MPTGSLNISPEGFHRWATHYLKCRRDFQSPHKFSPVPYFLLCRAIELEIKSRLLLNKKTTRDKLKPDYSHDLVKAYEALDKAEQQILNQNEVECLKKASQIYYKPKGFQYFDPKYAVRAYKEFPDLVLLDSVAEKLIEMTSVIQSARP